MKKIISGLCFLIGAILLFIRFAPTPSTQTAIAPTYTALPTYTPAATYTAMPTYTALPTHTPLPTDTPQPSQTNAPTIIPTALPPRPTRIPLPTKEPLPIGVNTSGEIDADAVNYFRSTYETIGNYKIKAKFNAQNLGGVINVSFDLDLDEYQYLDNNFDNAALRTWGESILVDMKTHWPKNSVSASLAWVYYLDDGYSPNTDCFYMGDQYVLDKGFYHVNYLVRSHYYSDISSEKVTVCKF